MIATGFLALSRRYATAPFELWHLTLEDTIDTTGRAFLGLTLRCARCHDHKFDPVTPARLLRALRDLRQHDVSLRRLGRAAIEVVPADEFRADLRRRQEAEAKLERYERRLAELDREAKALESKSDPASKSRMGEAPCANGRSCAGRRCRRTFRAAMP